MACILLWSSAVRVHDSQAYRKMDVTRERISRILKLREIFLSIQTMVRRSSCGPIACWMLARTSTYFLKASWQTLCTWSLWQSQASVLLFWSLCWCHWRCLSSAWSSRNWSPFRSLWRLCRNARLILPKLAYRRQGNILIKPMKNSRQTPCLGHFVLENTTTTLKQPFLRYKQKRFQRRIVVGV